MHSKFRSVLLAEIYKGNKEIGRWWWSEKNSFLARSHRSKKYFRLCSIKIAKTLENTSQCCLAEHWTHLSIFYLIHSCSHDKSGRGERDRRKQQCSLASRMTEWHFYDVSQIIPWDGWAELEHQLINPSTGGMCCGHPPAQLFFPSTEHSDRHAGEDD